MNDRTDSEPEPPRVRLEYFAADVPRDPESRHVMFCWTALGLGWLPFACGVVSSQAVVNSGVEETVIVHHQAGAAFMVCGMLISIFCILAFLRRKNGSAVLLAGLMLMMQICLFLCVGAV